MVAVLCQHDGSPEPERSSGDTGFERKMLTSHCRIGLRTWSGQCWHCHPLLQATDMTSRAQYSPGIAYQSMLSIKILLGLIAMLFYIALGNQTVRGFFQGEWQGKWSWSSFPSTALHRWTHLFEVLTREGCVVCATGHPKDLQREKDIALFSVLHNLWFAGSVFSLVSVAM